MQHGNTISGPGQHGIGAKGTEPLSSKRAERGRDQRGDGHLISRSGQSHCLPHTFFSVYDLQDQEEDGDILERLTPGWLSGSPEETVIRSLTMACLQEEFLQLSKKDQEILGRCFGVYGHPKSDLREIAMRNRMKESGVEKAKDQAIKLLRDRCQNSLAWKLRRARRMMDQAVPTEVKMPLHSGWKAE